MVNRVMAETIAEPNYTGATCAQLERELLWCAMV